MSLLLAAKSLFAIGRLLWDAAEVIIMGGSKESALAKLSSARSSLNNLISEIEANQAVDEALWDKAAEEAASKVK